MWFLRAIEVADGWSCRHGLREFDRHAELQPALDHLRELALVMESAELVVHRLDGTIEAVV